MEVSGGVSIHPSPKTACNHDADRKEEATNHLKSSFSSLFSSDKTHCTLGCVNGGEDSVS